MYYHEKFNTIRNIVIVIVLILLVLGFAYADYCWTRSSLEDLTGKEVKPETVIWTMMKTGNKK